MSVIDMVGDPALYLSPFSAHQIEIWGKVFPTAEHAYQWKKFSNPEVQDSILGCKSPLAAWNEAQKYKKENDLLDPLFNKYQVMEEIFRTKLIQHEDVKDILLKTNNLEIIKVHAHDTYWGNGTSGNGLNMMGKIWMKLREEISKPSQNHV